MEQISHLARSLNLLHSLNAYNHDSNNDYYLTTRSSWFDKSGVHKYNMITTNWKITEFI